MKKIIETVADGGGELGVHMYPLLQRHSDVYLRFLCETVLNLNSVFTLAVSGTGTDIMQKPFKLAMSEARTGHLKAIEMQLKHTTWNSFRTWKVGT